MAGRFPGWAGDIGRIIESFLSMGRHNPERHQDYAEGAYKKICCTHDLVPLNVNSRKFDGHRQIVLPASPSIQDRTKILLIPYVRELGAAFL
jgi:hypothetical protein